MARDAGWSSGSSGMGVIIFARNGRHQQLAAHLIANQQHERCLVPSTETAFAMEERQERLTLRARAPEAAGIIE